MKNSSFLAIPFLVFSFVSIFGKGIYYDEFKKFQHSAIGKIIFDAEDNNGLANTQIDIEATKAIIDPAGIVVSKADKTGEECPIHYAGYRYSDFWEKLKIWQEDVSLSSINRAMLTSKELTFIQEILQFDVQSVKPIIISPETMPQLYEYIKKISDRLQIKAPATFIAQQEGFSIYSRKILLFKGTLLIGQDLLHDLSDEELEALIMRELGSIKYNHYNKKCFSKILGIFALSKLINVFINQDNNQSMFNDICASIGAGLLVEGIFNRIFERSVDTLSSDQGKAEGLIQYYKRLAKKERARDKNFEITYKTLHNSRQSLSLLMYTLLTINYYAGKTEHMLMQLYNSITHNSPAERISMIKNA